MRYIFIFQALDSLQQISDGSLDEIEFPNLKIKQEEGLEEFDLPTDCLEVDMIGKNDTVRKRRIKKSYFCHLCNKTYRDSWKLKRHVKVHIKAGDLPEGESRISRQVFFLKDEHFLIILIFNEIFGGKYQY